MTPKDIPSAPSAAIAAGLIAIGCAVGPTSSTVTADGPPELGAVEWGRRLEPALTASAANGKPVLLLFQEIPG